MTKKPDYLKESEEDINMFLNICSELLYEIDKSYLDLFTNGREYYAFNGVKNITELLEKLLTIKENDAAMFNEKIIISLNGIIKIFPDLMGAIGKRDSVLVSDILFFILKPELEYLKSIYKEG